MYTDSQCDDMDDLLVPAMLHPNDQQEENGSQQRDCSDDMLRLIKKILRQQSKQMDKLGSIHEDLATLMAEGTPSESGEQTESSLAGKAEVLSPTNCLHALNRAAEQQILSKGAFRRQRSAMEVLSSERCWQPEQQLRSLSSGTGRNRPFPLVPCRQRSLTDRAQAVPEHGISEADSEISNRMKSYVASSSHEGRSAKKPARVQDAEAESHDMPDSVEKAKGPSADVADVRESTTMAASVRNASSLASSTTGRRLLDALTRMREAEIASTFVIGR
eukprot:TRINITY_DN6265_c0_g5_i3.p1 TRINITY_DN6265_c0_g5~~TRINITY_DN6265_c0_g5_i3.p1  ORF type:complete len:275 (+),score=46.27 TRINITY_DN6265_c0_g5_i3:92-916(+)